MRVKSTNGGTGMVPPTDVQIVTSDGNTVVAHSSVLVIQQLEIEFCFEASVSIVS